MSDFQMPSLGADMDAGTLVAWRIAPGDVVRRGQVVAEVETAKGIVEVEVWQDGTVSELLVPTGTKVPVGTVLATLRSGREASAPSVSPPVPSAPAAPPAPSPLQSVPPTSAAATVAPVARAPAAATPAEPPRSSPAARQRARTLGVDLAALHGTGYHGAISVGDVERAAATPAPTSVAAATLLSASAVPAAATLPSPAPPRSPSADRATAMRQAIAAAMARSKREIPHYYLATDVDMSPALAWLQAENLRRPVTDRLLPAALLLKAVAVALRHAPQLNGFWIDGAFRPGAGAHVGVAIALRGGGLVAPAIHDADRRPLGELMRALGDLTQRARSGTLRSSELTDATLTVTNLGDQGVASVFGVIYPPQVALVGLGRISDRPWAVDGLLGVRPVVTVSLAADHRASDGHLGGRFLAALGALLQQPEQL